MKDAEVARMTRDCSTWDEDFSMPCQRLTREFDERFVCVSASGKAWY